MPDRAASSPASNCCATSAGHRCRQDYNWWHTGAAIVTQGGCRGEFEVAFSGTMPPPSTRLIECGDASWGQHECKTEGYATSVRVERQRRAVTCRLGSNWGHTDTARPDAAWHAEMNSQRFRVESER
jgi:hypothetical protein